MSGYYPLLPRSTKTSKTRPLPFRNTNHNRKERYVNTNLKNTIKSMGTEYVTL